MSVTLQIRTSDGSADCHVCVPEGAGPFPPVILYMDGIGIRPGLVGLGERLARLSYLTLIPNLFYRDGPAEPADIAKVLSPGPENDRMMSRVIALTGDQVMRDTEAFLGYFSQEAKARTGKVGTLGYCMGGSMALRAAAAYPDRVAAAASIHGAGLATGRPDSPHLLAPKLRGDIYVGVAGIDPWLTEGETQTLQESFEAAGVRYQLDTFPGATHGFALPDLPVFDQKAAEGVWERLTGLFADVLR